MSIALSVLLLLIIQWDVFKRNYINIIGIDLLIPKIEDQTIRYRDMSHQTRSFRSDNLDVLTER